MPGVVSVFPNLKRRLHTTHSWDFMGLVGEETMEIPGYSTKNQENVIIGFIDTGQCSFNSLSTHIIVFNSTFLSFFLSFFDTHIRTFTSQPFLTWVPEGFSPPHKALGEIVKRCQVQDYLLLYVYQLEQLHELIEFVM